MILIERPAGDGLYADEIRKIVGSFNNNDELLPVEFDSRYGASSAMGFVTVKGEERMYAENKPVDVEEKIGEILSDMSLEREDCTYRLFGITFYLSRNVWDL